MYDRLYEEQRFFKLKVEDYCEVDYVNVCKEYKLMRYDDEFGKVNANMNFSLWDWYESIVEVPKRRLLKVTNYPPSFNALNSFYKSSDVYTDLLSPPVTYPYMSGRYPNHLENSLRDVALFEIRSLAKFNDFADFQKSISKEINFVFDLSPPSKG